jgi:hypothetical protein
MAFPTSSCTNSRITVTKLFCRGMSPPSRTPILEGGLQGKGRERSGQFAGQLGTPADQSPVDQPVDDEREAAEGEHQLPGASEGGKANPSPTSRLPWVVRRAEAPPWIW